MLQNPHSSPLELIPGSSRITRRRRSVAGLTGEHAPRHAGLSTFASLAANQATGATSVRRVRPGTRCGMQTTHSKSQDSRNPVHSTDLYREMNPGAVLLYTP